MADGTGGSSRRAAAWSAAGIALAVLLLTAPALLSDGVLLYRDAGRMHAPTRRWIAGELTAGRLPAWNPLAGLGSPVLSSGADGVLHPFTLLSLAAGPERGGTLAAVLSLLLAGLGALCWARSLGLPPAAAAVAGLAFALSGHLVSSTDNGTFLAGLAFAPWVLAAGQRWVEEGGAGRLLGLGAASYLCAAGGDPQAWGIAVALLPVQAALLRGEAGPARGLRTLRVLGGVLAAALAAAPVLAPLAAYLAESSRTEPLEWIDYLRWNLHPLRLLELGLPGLLRGPEGQLQNPVFAAFAGNRWTTTPWVLSIYAGAPVVALALLGAAADRRARWLLAGAAVFAWMALGHHAGFAQLASRLPVLQGFRYWEKLAAWVTLLLAGAAAVGAHRLLVGGARAATPDAPGAGQGRARVGINPDAPSEVEGRPVGSGHTSTPRCFALAAGGVGAALLGAAGLLSLWPASATAALAELGGAGPAAALVENLRSAARAAGLSLALLALVAWLLAAGRVARLGPALLAALVALDLLGANAHALVVSERSTIPEDAPLAAHLRARGSLERVVTPFQPRQGGWPGLRPFEAEWRWGARTLQPAWNVALGVGNFEAYTSLVPIRSHRYRRRTSTADRARCAGTWGVGHAVLFEPRPGEPPFAPTAPQVEATDPELPAWLVAIPHRPRAYLAARVEAVDRRGAMEWALDCRHAAGRDVVVEAPAAPVAGEPVGSVALLRDEPAHVALEASADRPALLVLNDTFTTGWAAAVDGRPVAILPTNYLARGVVVEAGRHLVEFRYATPGLRVGLALCGLFAAGVAALAWLERRRKRGPP